MGRTAALMPRGEQVLYLLGCTRTQKEPFLLL